MGIFYVDKRTGDAMGNEIRPSRLGRKQSREYAKEKDDEAIRMAAAEETPKRDSRSAEYGSRKFNEVVERQRGAAGLC